MSINLYRSEKRYRKTRGVKKTARREGKYGRRRQKRRK